MKKRLMASKATGFDGFDTNQSKASKEIPETLLDFIAFAGSFSPDLRPGFLLRRS